MFLKDVLQVYDLTPNKQHLELTIEHISTLALAYYFTADLKYARRARDKAAAWFLDQETAMVARFAGACSTSAFSNMRFVCIDGKESDFLGVVFWVQHLTIT